MPTFRANVQYIVGLNNSRRTSVNVHRSSANNRPHIPNWSITPNVYAQTGYGPNDLDPQVGRVVPPPPPGPSFVLLDYGVVSDEKLLLENSLYDGFDGENRKYYMITDDSPNQRLLVDQHYGLFIQTDFHSPITKTLEANNASEARALFIATYGPNSLVDEPQQI